MPRRKDGQKTRDAILAAAAACFAERGYLNTTNAAIARSCGGINPALIHYYFGDKATLYIQAWEHAHSNALKKYPLYGNVASDAPAVKRLRGIITSDILHRSDPKCRDNDIMLNELGQPTGILPDIHAVAFDQLRQALREVVAEILGDTIPAEEQRLAVLSIFALCTVPVRHIQTQEGNPLYTYDPAERAAHAYDFAMAGLLDILNRRK